MSIITTIERLARNYGDARARYLTERALNRLPQELQKDIGWPNTLETRPDRACTSGHC